MVGPAVGVVLTRKAQRMGDPSDNGTASSGDDWSGKKVFTTGEAARVCKVSQQTIIRCFDSGRLSGFRVPGSKFRRIPRDELIRFMHANDIPTDVLGSGRRRVLVVDDDREIGSLVSDLLEDDGRFEVRVVETGYDAGLETERFKPDLIVLDYMLPDLNGDLVCERIRASEAHASTKILFVSGVIEPGEVEKLMGMGADGFVRKPFDVRALVSRVTELLEMEASA
jgi:excisionase family DNA binding protein